MSQYIKNKYQTIDVLVNNLNDINITIVNDGSNVYISDKLLNSYSNLNINYIKNMENNGPGVTRQIGLDNTNDNYIMFMDADDALASNIALYVIMSCINDVKPDLIITNIVNERKTTLFDFVKRMYK